MKLSTLGALATLIALQGCSTSAQDAEWRTQIALEAPNKLGGCAVGDLDPDAAGDEIVAVSIDGSIILITREATGYRSEVVARAPGELIQCAVGDADPTRPGNEILAVGMAAGTEDDGGAGAAFLVSRGSDGWELERVMEDVALIHGGCIADVDPEHPGAELVVAGFGRIVFVLYRDGEGWVSQRATELEGPAKSVVGFAGGAAVACADGALVLVEKRDGSWSSRVLDHAPAGQSRLGTDGERLVVARDDGVLALVELDGTRTEIHREGDKLRGAVLAELDPARPGPEAATAGYARAVRVLAKGGGGAWDATTVFEDTDRYHHLTSGELWSESPGRELVGCGYSGRVVVIGLAPPADDQ